MNLKKRLLHLAMLGDKDRATGRTTLIARAAKELNGIVLAHNVDEAKRIEHAHGVSSRSIDINLEGFIGPFFIDHHAVDMLFIRAADKIEALEKQAEAQAEIDTRAIEGLTNEIVRLNRQLDAAVAGGLELGKRLRDLLQKQQNEKDKAHT